MTEKKKSSVSNRRDDIAVAICQNNDEKTLIITSVNDPQNELEEISLFSAYELAGKDIREILPQTIKENVEDYLEFEDNGNDLASVISKSRQFGLINKSGDFINLTMKIYRDASPDENAHFIMAIQGKSRKAGKGSFRVLEVLKKNQVSDKTTGAAEKSWFEEESEIAHFYVGRKKLVASFAVAAIDDFEDINIGQGEKMADSLATEISGHCQRTFRGSDMIGYLGQGKFGILLIGADLKNSQIPLNRLRWETANNPEETEKNTTISVSFKEIKTGRSANDTLDDCLKILKKHEGKSNQMLAA